MRTDVELKGPLDLADFPELMVGTIYIYIYIHICIEREI